MEKSQTRQLFIIKMGYLIGTLRWRNNALSVQKYVMAAPRAVSDFKRWCPFPCLSIPWCTAAPLLELRHHAVPAEYL